MELCDEVETAALRYYPATNTFRVLLNSIFMTSLSLKQQQGLVIHEYIHYLENHPYRGRGKEEDRWATAADMVDNWIFDRDFPSQKNHPELPEGACRLTERLRKKLKPEEIYAEFIYRELDDNEVQKSSGNGWESAGAASSDQIQSQVLQNAQLAARAAGGYPGHVQLIINRLKESKLTWSRILRQRIGTFRKIRTVPTLMRDNRRYGNQAEGYKDEHSARLAVIVDRSASVQKEHQIRFFSEIDYRSKYDEIMVIVCDTQVHEVFKYKRRIPIILTGEGGTDLNPALERADQMKAYTILIFSDGQLFIPPIETRTKQLWCITAGGTIHLLGGREVIRMND